jgi:ribosome-binding protein aMBF1 (putative translation factor)
MKRFKSAKELGAFLGLSDLEIELIQQKKKIIEKIKKARQTRGHSQAELAKLVGTKQPAIARMESGQVSEVSLDFLAKVAFALGVSFTIKSAKAA